MAILFYFFPIFRKDYYCAFPIIINLTFTYFVGICFSVQSLKKINKFGSIAERQRHGAFLWNNFSTNSNDLLLLAYFVHYLLFNLKIYLSWYFPHDMDSKVGPTASFRIVVSPQEPLTETLSPSPKRSAVQTPRNTNTAQSFLWGRGSSKSVPDSPADPAPLSRWDTPLIKATDCTLC